MQQSGFVTDLNTSISVARWAYQARGVYRAGASPHQIRRIRPRRLSHYRQVRFSPNTTKTQVIRTRARKVILGLLVDKAEPRLTKDFKKRLQMHLYYLKNPKFGPASHVTNRGFAAVTGLRNHLAGLAAYAAQVEPAYAARIKAELEAISWP